MITITSSTDTKTIQFNEDGNVYIYPNSFYAKADPSGTVSIISTIGERSFSVSDLTTLTLNGDTFSDAMSAVTAVNSL